MEPVRAGRTDRLVRGYLAQRGLKKGDLSALVAEGARSIVLRKIAEELRAQNPEAADHEIQAALESAVRRAEMRNVLEEVWARNAECDPADLEADIAEAIVWVRAHPA